MPDGNSYVFNATKFGDLTREEWEAKISGSVDYLGLVSSLSGLSTTAGYGDFHRVSAGFTDSTSGKSVHSGDLLVANKANPAQNLNEENWVIVHGEEGNLISHSHEVTIPAKTLYNANHNHTFTGTAAEHDHSFSGTAATLKYTPAGSVGISVGTGTANYTPAGTVTSTINNVDTSTPSTEGIEVSTKAHTHNVSASGSYTPAGSVSATFTGGNITLTGSAAVDEEHNADASAATHTHAVTMSIATNTNGNYTPAGSVSQPTFSNGSASADSTNKADVAAQGHTHTVTGTVSKPTFTGTEATISGTTGNNSASESVMDMDTTYDSSTQTLTFASVSVAKNTHTHSYSSKYTPAGSVSQPTFSDGVAKATTATAVSASTSIHTHSVTGTVSKPTFTGTKVLISATTAASSDKIGVATADHTHDVSVNGTTTGSITGLKFTGTAATINVSGTASASSASTKVATSDHIHSLVSSGVTSTFAGTGVRLIGSFSGTEGSISYTPSGTISKTSITPAGSIANTSITVSFPVTTVTSGTPK